MKTNINHMQHIAFKCCKCGTINVFESQDGSRCMKCGDGYLNPIGNCIVHNNSKNVLDTRISIDTTDIDIALKKVNLLNDRINDTVLRIGRLNG